MVYGDTRRDTLNTRVVEHNVVANMNRVWRPRVMKPGIADRLN